ncbi:MAG: Hsp20/alpha crystallin family protein [Candidatus Methylomirabilaceae bacterium]
MSLSVWNPLDELSWLQESLDVSGDDLLGGSRRPARRLPRWVPSVDVLEAGNNIVIRARMPGIDLATLRVDVSAEIVSLKGEAKVEADHRDCRYHRRELPYGIFRRVIVLPAPVDPTTARASYRDGVLEIRATKAPRVSLHVAHVEVK